MTRRAAHLFAQTLVEERRRGFFDDLLVAALDGTIALAQVHDAPVAVGDHLELDVSRVEDEVFQNTRPALPNAFSASARAAWKPWTRLTSLCAARIPRPPPPALALIMMG